LNSQHGSITSQESEEQCRERHLLELGLRLELKTQAITLSITPPKYLVYSTRRRVRLKNIQKSGTKRRAAAAVAAKDWAAPLPPGVQHLASQPPILALGRRQLQPEHHNVRDTQRHSNQLSNNSVHPRNHAACPSLSPNTPNLSNGIHRTNRITPC
jgi:hypothetical protein